MIRLRDTATGEQVGKLTEAQLEFLVDQLEEESSVDQDYYLDAGTLELLEDAGADAELLTVLRTAIGDGDGIEISWSEE